MNSRSRVVVAMSGGVDSSVAAALLKQQGYEVVGMMLRLWSESGREADNRCCTPDAMALARRVAARLDIPFYAVDAQDIFHAEVVSSFVEGYLSGITPNPCVACNRRVRWEFLLERALSLGADFMATGHYARVQKDATGANQLLRGVDEGKDQSYVLHILGQAQLQHALFPLGEYTKPQVRQFAREFGLPVANRAESQDLCFLGAGDYREFLLRQAPLARQPGPILDREGRQIGSHEGLAFYTIGQRKGLGIAAPEPLYVLAKDGRNNALIVGPLAQLGRSSLLAQNANWVSGKSPAGQLHAGVKTRYKAPEAPAVLTPQDNGQVLVQLDAPLRDITPGQAAVFYQGEVCLGGGTIAPDENW